MYAQRHLTPPSLRANLLVTGEARRLNRRNNPMSILDDHTRYDPTAMPNQVAPTQPGTAEPSGKEVKDAKPSAKKIARDLLASFAPAAPVVESAAEKERKRRVEVLTTKVRQLAQSFDDLNAIDGDPVAAAAGLKALNTALSQGTKAIQALTDAKLAPEPKAPRTPKPAVTESGRSGSYISSGEATVDSATISDTAPTSTPASDDVDSNTGF
jgi:hypothetical protein